MFPLGWFATRVLLFYNLIISSCTTLWHVASQLCLSRARFWDSHEFKLRRTHFMYNKKKARGNRYQEEIIYSNGLYKSEWKTWDCVFGDIPRSGGVC